MSMAANVVLFADQGEPDWVADAQYLDSPVSPFGEADGVAVDTNGNVCVAMSGSPGFGVHCYNKYGGLRELRINEGITVTSGGVYSPDGQFVPYADGTARIFYTPTFDNPVFSGSTTQAFNIFDVNLATGAFTTFAVGRDSNVDFSDGGYTTMESGAGDSSGNFYGCGMTRRSGNNEYPYLVKYNSSGVVQWTLVLQPQIQKFTGGGGDSANFGSQPGMIADSSGNTYVSLRHTTDTSDPNAPVFTEKVMKFNTSGTQQWVREVSTGITVSATDGTYLYSVDASITNTVRVLALNVSDGSIAWERTYTISGQTISGGVDRNNVLVSGGSLYVGVATTDGGSPSNYGVTWLKISSTGTLEYNRHVYGAAGIAPTLNNPFFNAFYNSAIANGKLYSVLQSRGGLCTVKLPLDGSKTGLLTTLPYLGHSGTEPYTFTQFEAEINVDTLSVSTATTSTGTSTSSTYGTTTTTLTTSDVFTLALDVTYNASQISSILAPGNNNDPVVIYSKRQLL